MTRHKLIVIVGFLINCYSFDCDAQRIIINVYEVATFSKDTLTNSFDVFYYPDNIGDTIEVSKRYIINFSDSTFIEYIDGEIVSEGKFELVSEYFKESNQFFIIFSDSSNRKRGISSFINHFLYFEDRDESTFIELFEKYSIY